jgi:hypothetical protein
MNVIEKLKELNLPPEQFVVVSSGTLDALGIREARDIDLLALPELRKQLRESGEWGEDERYNKIFLTKGDVEILPDVSWDKYSSTVEGLIDSALVFEGFNFMNLDELIKFKTALGREKDFRDIELIGEYRENV